MEIVIGKQKLPCWFIQISLVKNSAEYYILVYGEDYTPLMKKGKILLFSKNLILKKLDIDIDAFDYDVALHLDFPKLYKTLMHKKKDSDSIILNTINLFSDFMKNDISAKDATMQEECFKILNPFADFLTFQKDFYLGYIKNNLKRIEIYSSLTYLSGHFINHLAIENNFDYNVYATISTE